MFGFLNDSAIELPELEPMIEAHDPQVQNLIYRAAVDGSQVGPLSCYINGQDLNKLLQHRFDLGEDEANEVQGKTFTAWFLSGDAHMYGEDKFNAPIGILMLTGECARTEEGRKAKANLEFLKQEIEIIVPQLGKAMSCSENLLRLSTLMSTFSEKNGNPNHAASVYYFSVFTEFGWIDSEYVINPPICHN